MNSILHPATRLSAWLALLALIQLLSETALFAAFLAVPLAGRAAMRRGGRLIWRARWLLVSLFFVFAWGVAGDPLWDGAFSPTREGIGAALQHLARLSLSLMSVAALLETLPLADMLAGTRVWLAPCRRLGLDADRGVVRLMLALRYVETLPRPRDWKSLLDLPESIDGETVEITHQRMRRIDGGIIVGLLAGLLLLGLY